MNLEEQFVASAFQSLGYFVIRGLRVGLREIDLVAIELVEGKAEYYHIEVQISYHAVGVLRAHPRFEKTDSDPLKAAEDYINKKFFQKDIVKTIEQLFGTSNYKRIFVHGDLKRPEQLKVFSDRGIECKRLDELIVEASRSSHKTDEFTNFFNISQMKKE